MGYTMSEKIDYINLAFLTKEVANLTLELKECKKRINEIYGELSDISETIEKLTDEHDALRENYSKHIGEY